VYRYIRVTTSAEKTELKIAAEDSGVFFIEVENLKKGKSDRKIEM
jgi:predicted  nucleic acid-binding Zn-ribbon protein